MVDSRDLQSRPAGQRLTARWLPWMVLLLTGASHAAATAVYNLTGLPTYPNLKTAVMDHFTRTDALGHRCTRFAATSDDALGAVLLWYRRAMVGASETDLNHDADYGRSFALSGSKLALGIDSVVIYRLANQSTTTIELFRCSAV